MIVAPWQRSGYMTQSVWYPTGAPVWLIFRTPSGVERSTPSPHVPSWGRVISETVSGRSSLRCSPRIARMSSIPSFERSVGVDHSPAAACSGYTRQPPGMGEPSANVPLAATAARAGSSGCW